MPEPGHRVYAAGRPLARGGMGEVEVVVRHEGAFQRVYARKRLHAMFAAEPEVRAMFVDEARIAGLIRHVNVVSVLDVGEDEAGPFLVMDLVDGIAVSRALSVLLERGERLPVPIALEIARQAALGLHAAHELRSPEGVLLDVVHRDVSPQNLLVGFDGTVRVTDFGVARALDRLAQTSEGMLKGKAGYMSPEQLRYLPLDRRSDVFSLGVVLWEMLASERLYAGDRPAAFRRILEETAPRVRTRRPDVPEDVDAIVASMLEKEPAARPATAREVAARLDHALRSCPANLAGFMETELAAERSRMAAIVEEALTTDPRAARHGRARRRRIGARGALAIGSLVLLGGAIAFAVALGSMNDGSEEPAQPIAAPEPAQAVAVQEPRPAPEASRPEPAPADVAPERSEAADTGAAEREEAPAARSKRPRRGATERRARETPGLWWELPHESSMR